MINGLTAFHRPGMATPQFIVNIFSSLYLINADGSGLHQLAMGGYCLGAAAVTADGQWIACTTGDGPDRLLVAALQSTGVSQAHEVQLSALPFYRDLSWSPDGRYLAVQLSDTDGTAQVAIFASPPPHTTFTRVVTLQSDLFTTEFCCEADSIFWASNSQLLLLHPEGTTTTLAQVSIADALRTFASSQPSMPVVQVVPSQQFMLIYTGPQKVLLPPVGPGYPPFDPHHSSLILLSSNDANALSVLDLGTGQTPVPLLTTSPQFTLIAGWMPDGHELFVVAGGQQCVDCFMYPVSDVYLYSLDAPSSKA